MNALDAVTTATARTPLWVWPALVLLIWFGLRQTRSRRVPVWVLAINPAILVALTGPNLIGLARAGAVIPVLGWFVLATVGAGIGGWTARGLAIKADMRARRLELPGSWAPFAIYMAVFVGRYVLGYLGGRWPELAGDATYLMAGAAFGGLMSGLLIGRSWLLWRRYQAAG